MADTVTYCGATWADALAAAWVDAARAQQAGFSWVSAEWGQDPGAPELAVTYEYKPVPAMVRSIVAPTAEIAADRLADDALAMWRAGYVPTAQSWAGSCQSVMQLVALGLTGLAYRDAGVLTVTYESRPDLTGGPSAAIPPPPPPIACPSWRR